MDSVSLVLLQCLSTIFKGYLSFPICSGNCDLFVALGDQALVLLLCPQPLSWHLRPAAACTVLLTEIQQHAVRGEGGTKFFLQVIGPVQQGLQLLGKLPPLRLWL